MQTAHLLGLWTLPYRGGIRKAQTARRPEELGTLEERGEAGTKKN